MSTVVTMSTQKVFIDHTKEPLLTTKSSYKPNLELFESEWVPKIKAYNEKLSNAIPKEFLAPSTLLPDDLDKTPFNAMGIPKVVLDEKALAITELTAAEIATKIADEELTASETILAFIKRATLAHQLTHCAMEILFEDGIKRAKELDEYQAKHGKTIGPLHGVPLSLKEHYSYKDHVTHAGYVSLLDNVSNDFAYSSQILYDLGAVFYIRTTEPQSLMHMDSINNITGRSRSPYKTTMSPGGSSSGEGALIAFKGSPLGLASDIGGSIRGPAAFNGIWGLKPTSKRVSVLGVIAASVDTYNETVPPVLGPLSNSVDDLELFMKSYLSKEPWEKDQQCLPIPWREVPIPTPTDLTIGIVYDDGVVKPHPPVIRALKEVEEKLRAAGVNVVKWEPHRVYEAIEVVNSAYTSDGNSAVFERLNKSGEPLAPLSEHFLQFGKGDKGLSNVENQAYTFTREVLRHEYMHLMNERNVDFLIAPTYVGVAPKPSMIKYWGYTSLWNLLDQTCVTFPSGVFADKEVDLKDESYKARNIYEEQEYGFYDPDAADGMPVGLTLVGRRYTEEKALKAAKLVSEIISVG